MQNSEFYSSEMIEGEQKKLYDIISRVKMIFITKSNITIIFSRLLQVCRKYNNHELFKYVFLKIVPFFYCLSEITTKTLKVIS